MLDQSRNDQETAAIIDRAVALYASGDAAQANALLAEHKLPRSMIGRVLNAPERRRAAHVESPPAQP